MDDETWGKVGDSRKVFMAQTKTFKGGESSLDKVLENILKQIVQEAPYLDE